VYFVISLLLQCGTKKKMKNLKYQYQTKGGGGIIDSTPLLLDTSCGHQVEKHCCTSLVSSLHTPQCHVDWEDTHKLKISERKYHSRNTASGSGHKERPHYTLVCTPQVAIS
jgi:hypothetical protein